MLLVKDVEALFESLEAGTTIGMIVGGVLLNQVLLLHKHLLLIECVLPDLQSLMELIIENQVRVSEVLMIFLPKLISIYHLEVSTGCQWNQDISFGEYLVDHSLGLSHQLDALLLRIIIFEG